MELGEFCSQAVSCLAGGLHGESAEKTHPGLAGPVPACSLAPHWTESSAPTQGLVATCMGNWSMSGQQLGWKEMWLAVAKNSQDTGSPSKATPLTTNRRVRGSIPGSETRGAAGPAWPALSRMPRPWGSVVGRGWPGLHPRWGTASESVPRTTRAMTPCQTSRVRRFPDCSHIPVRRTAFVPTQPSSLLFLHSYPLPHSSPSPVPTQPFYLLPRHHYQRYFLAKQSEGVTRWAVRAAAP